MDWIRGWTVGCALALLGSVGVEAQCADGTTDQVFVGGVVAGCAGAWTEKGVVDGDGNPVEPSCDRLAGNDGDLQTAADMRAAGASCSAADLCAFGWSLCGDDDASSDVSCDDTTFDEDALYVAATASCESDSRAQVVGCGTLGCESAFDDPACSLVDRQSFDSGEDPCATLNRPGCNDGLLIDGVGWSCVSDGAATFPAATVVKSGSDGGGVLCCFREVCDCVDESGDCYVNGESPEPCLICEGDGDPVEPLTEIEECSPETDAGVEDSDLGPPEPLDLGAPPNDFDAGADRDPEISFRGDGGCECRTAGEGAPTAGFLALVLFTFRRRR